MVSVVQLVRTPDCDSGGRGFEPHQTPHKDLIFIIDMKNFFNKYWFLLLIIGIFSTSYWIINWFQINNLVFWITFIIWGLFFSWKIVLIRIWLSFLIITWIGTILYWIIDWFNIKSIISWLMLIIAPFLFLKWNFAKYWYLLILLWGLIICESFFYGYIIDGLIWFPIVKQISFFIGWISFLILGFIFAKTDKWL